MSTPRRPVRARVSLRARLTLLYVSLFALTCAGLLTLTYTLVRSQLSPEVLQRVESPAGASPDLIPAPAPSPTEVAELANQAALRTLLTQSAIGFLVMTALAALLCWLVAGRALDPVRRITAVASRLSQHNLDDRIALPGPRDEVKTLADTFDSMLDRLGRAFDAERLFVANASHELRAPLTVIQTATELALAAPSRPAADYRRALGTVEDGVHRVNRILDSLLALARTRARAVRPEPFDLSDAVRRVVAGLPPGNPAVRTDLPAAPVRADPVLTELLVRNLLENAVRYNDQDGWVSVGTVTAGDRTVLRVENTGPMVPAERLPALTRPFHRGVQARTGSGPGSGLGLAIVDAIVEAHGGNWRLEARPAGGLLVTVTFPSSPEIPG